LKGDEKNKGLKKITDYIEKQMKAILKDKLGKIYKIRRRWAGDNPDGEFDSIFVFAEYKSDVKESTNINVAESYVASSTADFDLDDISGGGNVLEDVKPDGEVIWLPASIANKIINAWTKHVGSITATRNGYAYFIGGSEHEFTVNDTTIKSVTPIIGGEKFYKALKFVRENPSEIGGDIDETIQEYKEKL
jgi:hypothetical protein